MIDGAMQNSARTFLCAVCQLTAIAAMCLFSPEPVQAGKAGFEDVPEFGGPSSVGPTLKEDDEVKTPVFRWDGIQRGLQPYFDWKGRVNKQHGLAFGSDYTLLYQGASEGLGGEDDAAGGILRLFGTWTALGRDSGNTGSLVYKVENRHKIVTDIPPQDLGFAIGYAGLTAAPYADYGWGLTNLYWKQRFKQGRISFVAGVVDATDYIDVYGLVNPWTAFSNLAFSTNPAIPVPNQGLGAAVGAMVTERLYIIGGLADANGDPTEPGDMFDSFFDDNEYFKHIEVGWTSSQDRIYLDNMHLTLWQVDEREKAGVADGWGAAFSFAKFLNDTWMPFVRIGYANDGGALWEKSLSAGVGYYLTRRTDLLGIGLNWSEPSETAVAPGLDDQYTAELFYRLQIAQQFAVTPSLQWIKDPALNPNEKQIWVLGVRARLAF
ncbi:MAG: carbohydrate porin [Pseudomonadota bacterium]|nr:MAG: carbohydrate porin [Pseudomonadota bacterium]